MKWIEVLGHGALRRVACFLRLRDAVYRASVWEYKGLDAEAQTCYIEWLVKSAAKSDGGEGRGYGGNG